MLYDNFYMAQYFCPLLYINPNSTLRHFIGNDGYPNRISFPNAIIWNTPTGLKPNDKPLIVVNNAKLSLPVVVIYTASVVIVILLTFNEIRRHIKPRPGFQVYSNATIPCLLGILMLEVIVILYPFTNRHLFCPIAPILASYGYMLIIWSIATRLGTRVVTKPEQRRFKQYLELTLTKSNWLSLIWILLILAILFATWFCIFGMPNVSVTFDETFDISSDTLTKIRHEYCSSNGHQPLALYIPAGCIAAMLGFGLLNLMAKAITKRNHNKDLIVNFVKSANCIVPSTIAGILVITIGSTMNLKYYVVVPILQLQVLTLLILAGTQFKGKAQPGRLTNANKSLFFRNISFFIPSKL